MAAAMTGTLSVGIEDETSSKDRFLALLFSVFSFGLILLFLILFIIKTPIPPYPPAVITEVQIDFEGGGGADGAEGIGNPKMTNTQKTKSNSAGDEEDVFANKDEDPVLTVKNTKKKKTKKEPKEIPKTETS
jgi:hypothetical protein